MSEAKSKITLMSLWPPIVSFFRLKLASLRATNNFIQPFFPHAERSNSKFLQVHRSFKAGPALLTALLFSTPVVGL